MPWITVKATTVDRLAAISLSEGHSFVSTARPIPGEPDSVRILLDNDVFLAIAGRAAREGKTEDQVINEMTDRYNTRGI